MNYNEIGKHIEEAYGATEFWWFTPNCLQRMFSGQPPKAKHILKNNAGVWEKV